MSKMDDLISFFFVMIEMLGEEFPWRKIKNLQNNKNILVKNNFLTIYLAWKRPEDKRKMLYGPSKVFIEHNTKRQPSNISHI